MSTSFTYHLPGGLEIIYRGEDRSSLRWLADTWRAGLSIWRIWLRVAIFMIATGLLPRPESVTRIAIGVIEQLTRELATIAQG
jgi:hypothetical protein